MLGRKANEFSEVRSLGIYRVGDMIDDKPLTATNEANGEIRRFEISTTPVRGDDGEILATVSIVTDVEDRHQADEHRAVLNRELSHRLKNTLAVVPSVATQTLRNLTDIKAAQATLSQRIGALANAHDVLLAGHRDAGSKEELVRAARAVHDTDGRIRTLGEGIRLGSRASLSLSSCMWLRQIPRNTEHFLSKAASRCNLFHDTR